MNLRRSTSVTLALSLGAASALAQEVEPGGAKAASPASAVSFSDTWKNLRGKFKSDSKPADAPADPGASAAASPATTQAPATQQPGASQGSAPALKIKTFTTGSKLPGDWNDAHCKLLVEPFGLTDSAVSLGKLKTEIELQSVVGKVTGQKAGAVDKRVEIRNAARRLNWLPMPAEVMIGKKMRDEQTDLLREDRKGNKEVYERARRVLADVLAQVKETHPYRFEIDVVNASGGNAEAAPGGFIFVDKDLVSKASQEPLARFAIAHEVSHVLQRHRTRETQMRLADGIDSVDDLGKLMASAQGNMDGLLKKGVDLKRLFVKHSEQQELQADGCAVRLLDGMSRDRAEMLKSINAFVQSLPKPVPAEAPKKSGTDAVVAELSDGQFSRHPSTEQRIKNLNLVMADLKTGK